jgi:signal transduction histidine kinase
VAAIANSRLHESTVQTRPGTASRQRLLGSPARVAGLWTAFAGIAVTVLFTILPGLDFAYRQPPLRSGLETAEALVALLAAYLLIGRLRRTQSLDDLVATVALITLAGGDLIFGAIPAISSAGDRDHVTGLAGVGARLLGALLFAAAALAPRRKLPRTLKTSLTAIGAACAVLAGLSISAWFLRNSLPAPTSMHPKIFGNKSVVAVQFVAMLSYTAAAVGFASRADRRPDDELMRWFGAASVFATYAWLSYSLSPALYYTDWVFPADVLRLLFYLMLLVGAAREINGYWRRSALTAVLEERRRLARDLHDGLAQELAYISRAATQLDDADADPDLQERLRAAAQRALSESRQVIAALATPADGPMEGLLERVASEAAARFGVEVELDVASGAPLDSARQEALIRITGEAVANAARHSGTTSVRVVLDWHHGRPRLQVIDRGVGFDTAESPRGGFGLTSMRERAAAVGAHLKINSAPGAGTRVEVAF